MDTETIKTLYVLFDPETGMRSCGLDHVLEKAQCIEIRLVPVKIIQPETGTVCVPLSASPAESKGKTPKNPPAHTVRVAHESWLW